MMSHIIRIFFWGGLWVILLHISYQRKILIEFNNKLFGLLSSQINFFYYNFQVAWFAAPIFKLGQKFQYDVILEQSTFHHKGLV